MKIMGLETLDAFCSKHADVRKWVGTWKLDVEAAQWNGPQDIKNRYSTVSFLSANMVIFNVKGNTYRLETKVNYQTKMVLIKWAGTHAEYDRR
ncbi:MAG: type II toxin-antitoxin system HigB family toxin [Proteobacteria bacterium]|nr:MAG: type II toxin-antitoxin system HigB family toxin [Pseudomonadota bacterium]